MKKTFIKAFTFVYLSSCLSYIQAASLDKPTKLNTFSRADDIIVTGKVVGETGTGMPGVSVVVEGTTTGTTTDVNGDYKIKAPSNGVLIFSYVGYVKQNVPINKQVNIVVTLVADTKQLGEVVVVGYGTQSRKNLSSAITTVKPGDMNVGPISDVGQLLQGKVPGLNITSSGNPNTNAAVILRGASTINSSQGPFYVIDGLPGADISTIAPSDIASIDVLKDAAATAIYGNRAANGVIVVTTRRGKAGQMQINYNGYVGMEAVSNQLNVMNADELRAFLTKNNLSFSPNDDKGAHTNWQDAVQRSSAISHNHNLAISGGTEHSNYSMSLNYIKRDGVIKGSSLDRVIARLSMEQYALKDKVKFGLTITA
ncbi:MAG: TonB-dependent receptor plug domain-containing protein [Siphonobacter sp.]